MLHTMLDAAPIPAPARCGRKKSDYQYYSHHNGLILKNDSTQKGQTSMEVTPATSTDYDNSSMGASLPFVVMLALYLCLRFVRSYRRKNAL